MRASSRVGLRSLPTSGRTATLSAVPFGRGSQSWVTSERLKSETAIVSGLREFSAHGTFVERKNSNIGRRPAHAGKPYRHTARCRDRGASLEKFALTDKINAVQMDSFGRGSPQKTISETALAQAPATSAAI